jgi:hypothetical protein
MEIPSLRIALDEEALCTVHFAGHLADEGVMRGMDMRIVMGDQNDTTVMHTHTALNWSDPADYDTDVHLALASATDFFGIVDWDAEGTVDFSGNGTFAVRVSDHSLAGDDVLRLDADGDFAKAEHTL